MPVRALNDRTPLVVFFVCRLVYHRPMYKFGTSSEKHLATMNRDLVRIPRLVMSWQVFDFSIVWGHRGEAEQNQAYADGNSSKVWPNSLHNILPAPAFDFAPYIAGVGIPWNDTHAFAVLGGMMIAAGEILDIPVVYGGDWDMDGETTDQILMDWGHVQMRDH